MTKNAPKDKTSHRSHHKQKNKKAQKKSGNRKRNPPISARNPVNVAMIKPDAVQSTADDVNFANEEAASTAANLGPVIRTLLSPDPTLVVSALAKLRSLNLHLQPGNQGVRAKAVDYGVCPLTIIAMESHNNHALIQEDAVALLGNLTIQDETSIHDPIMGHGGLTATVNAMLAFPQKSDLQYNALKFFDNILSKEFVGQVMVDEGGINVILAALKNHLAIDDVLVWACCALTHLAGDFGHAIICAGGLTTLAKCAETHPNNPDLHAAVKEAIEAIM